MSGYDEATWTYNEADGYYYYNEPLEPGNKTEPLFASVTVDKDMSNEYHNCTAFVNVYAFAVQSNYNGDTALSVEVKRDSQNRLYLDMAPKL